ncbi:hypothetical protein GCM10027517_23920 [Phycicoccus ginsengisoli]
MAARVIGPEEASQSDPAMAAAGLTRSSQLRRGILTSFISRGIAAVGPLVLIPITLRYLGAETYGLWMAVSAVAAMVMWADLGLGNGLMTQLGERLAVGDTRGASRLISTTYALLGAASLTLIGAIWLCAPWIPWTRLLGATTAQTSGQARAVALICLSAFLINIPLSLVQRVQYARQEVSQSNLWQAAAGLLTIATTGAAVALTAAPIEVIAASSFALPLTNTINAIWFFSRNRELRPTARRVSRNAVRGLMSLGGQFLLVSVLTSVAINSDNLIVAHTLSLAEVTTYAVPAKLLTALGLVVSLLNLPLWPAAADALARGETEWVKRTVSRMTLLSGAAVAVPAVCLVAFGPHLIRAWSSVDVSGRPGMLLGLSLWWLMLAIASPRLMVQNARGYLRPQVLGWLAFVLIGIPLKLLAAQKAGLAGLALTGAAAYMAFLGPAVHVGYRRTLKQTLSGSGQQ